jgi:hypothetical protein
MKKTSIPKKVQGKEDLLGEYRFDYSKARPNRFAAKMPAETIAVVLEPDIAAVFKSAKTVNAALRSVISGAAKPTGKRAR